MNRLQRLISTTALALDVSNVWRSFITRQLLCLFVEIMARDHDYRAYQGVSNPSTREPTRAAVFHRVESRLMTGQYCLTQMCEVS